LPVSRRPRPPTPSAFASLLVRFRLRSGVSQRALARDSGINPAIVSRIESGDRKPSGPPQVLALARALKLDASETDQLLASTGFWPLALLQLGPADATLLGVAGVLTDSSLEAATRSRFRQVLLLLVEQWRAAAPVRPPPTKPA
jgi:transcriptional regulator with XRE-family HTH domain